MAVDPPPTPAQSGAEDPRDARRPVAPLAAAEVLERMSDAFAALDPSLRYVAVNAAGERSMRRPRAALLGRTLVEAFPSAAGSTSERAYRRVAGTGVAMHFTEHYQGDGLDNYIEVDAYPTGDAPPYGVAVFWREVNERVRAAQALAERNTQLEDQQVELELANHRLQEQATELEAQSEELHATVTALEAQVARAERAVADLRASEAKYRALFVTMGQGFCIVEVLLDAAGVPRDYRFVEANPAFEAQTGLAHVEGQRARALIPGLEQHWIDLYGRVALTGEATDFQQGSAALGRWFDGHAFRIGAAADLRVAVLFTDVSAAWAAARERERLLAEAESARAAAEGARAAAEAANAAKAQFLANMSHELRTPLNAISGYVQLLDMGLHGPVTAEQRGALGRVHAAQRRLLALINDVLNYAKLESGRVEYDLRPVDVADVMRDVVPLVEPQVRAKGLVFDVRLPDGPCVVRADREKLGQVLVNLLSNAVKFTEATHPVTNAPGRVVVDVATRPGLAGAVVFLRVRDTGRGVPREKQDAIFEPFVQVRAGAGSAYAGATEGTGLGLAISRDLARGMGGDLRVRSAPSAGATFTIALRRVAGGAGGAGGVSEPGGRAVG